MNQIYLSDSGPKVSSAIYGFYRWNDKMDQVIEKMERIVNLCLELGINTFDHGEYYGAYQCESLFGQVMARKSIRREQVVLFTKCGLRLPHPSQPNIRNRHYDTSSKHLIQSLDQSLQRLGTDYIDIFLLDGLDPISNLEEMALTLQRLKDSGKVRHIGVANLSVFQHQLVASYLKAPIVTNHVQFNLLQTEALDNGQIAYCKQRFMRPLATAPLSEGRIAHGTDEVAIRVRDKLKEISGKYYADLESVAVAWLLKLGVLPVIGTTNERRIRNIAEAINIDLDRQDWYDLYAATRGKEDPTRATLY